MLSTLFLSSLATLWYISLFLLPLLLNDILKYKNFVAGARVIWAHAPGRVDFAANKNANSTLPHDNVLKLILSLVDGLSPRLLFSLNVVQTLILLSILLSWVR